MYTSIWWYLHVLPVLHRPEVVDIGVNTIKKNMPYEGRSICNENSQVNSGVLYLHTS